MDDRKPSKIFKNEKNYEELLKKTFSSTKETSTRDPKHYFKFREKKSKISIMQNVSVIAKTILRKHGIQSNRQLENQNLSVITFVRE